MSSRRKSGSSNFKYFWIPAFAGMTFVNSLLVIMNYKTLIVKKDKNILSVELNRPEVRNAFNDEVILELTGVFSESAEDNQIRLVLLSGAGEAFCAGGDIPWMKKTGSLTIEQNQRDAEALGRLLSSMNHFPAPVIAGVHGACFGGGLGLVSACDYVIASTETQFSFSEVRLGLIPAVIAPFVISKIGESQARALFLTAEKFSAARAFGIGLVHQVVENVENKVRLIEALDSFKKNILLSSPNALLTAKKFLADIREKKFEDKLKTACQTLAHLRSSEEGREGLSAFLEKRKPSWMTK